MSSEVSQAMNTRDAERLARLWTESQPAVAAYIFSLLPDFHQAEEVLQRVAATLVRRYDAYDGTRPFLPWALGIASNEVLKARRNVATDRHLFSDSLAEQLMVAYEEEADRWGPFRQALRQCLARQRGRSLDALRWRYVHDLGPTQVARQLGVTAGAVRVLLHRARRALRECIRRRMIEVLP